jgi:RNA recognition motif-containing protein
LKTQIMSIKIYFDNVAATTTERELTDLFSTYGNVVDVHSVVDRAHPKPHGRGFVTMITTEVARATVQALDGKAFGLSTLTLSKALPDGWSTRPPGSRRANSVN